jgi:hypothetical protein
MGLKAVSAAPALAANIDVGVSVITGGTTGRILYDNAGVLGELATTGAGVVALATGPTFVAPVLGAATGTTISTTGQHTAGNATAITAGGSLLTGHVMTTTANFGVFAGSGPPTISAAIGSLYLRSDGTTTNDRAYIATTATGTWTPLTTGA